ncbi:MAG: cysteine--tRNA ligase [Alphaproteobacteria bacterium]|nr:MAG: cysteine--tRNA ligase [Alphaproteobacteria bacterium]
MSLALYNTLTREKEEFIPRDAKRVTMYVCGPTVYDFAHIGNARPVVVFDVLYRLLKHLAKENRWGEVVYARNITDVDDKINAKGQEIVAQQGGDINAAIRQITQKFEKHYNDDMGALGCLPPDHTPHATNHIADMIAMIQTLIDRGHAYAAEGHVLFNAPSMKDYGKLSRNTREELVAGARVDVAPFKKDPTDFVLWKPSSADLPGWESPWGRGRPGWHIECSAMSRAVLGNQIDIHGGGLDLRFPHHENEIAQSECSCDAHPFARYWMHNGYLTVNGEKMSKSLGNFFTVQDVLAKAPGEAIRLALLMARYNQPLDWTDQLLTQAMNSLDRLYVSVGELNIESSPVAPSQEFMEALLDDLNTPAAIMILHTMASKVNKESDPQKRLKLAAELKASANLVGLLNKLSDETINRELSNFELENIGKLIAEKKYAELSNDHQRVYTILYKLAESRWLTEEVIKQLVDERKNAKLAKNYSYADYIKRFLLVCRIELKDLPGNETTWKLNKYD